ncbi:hypothetical protein JTB14_000304 [Gonioctena quinquepunctata]|nr:hypothetical protein JTB14_000304 [Gonioctena quinquepunctata]
MHRNTGRGVKREQAVTGFASPLAARESDVHMPRNRPNRPRTTAKAAWSEEDLLNAKNAIERGMSKRKVATTHNILFTKLRKRLENENMSSPQLGRKPIHNQHQERDI